MAGFVRLKMASLAVRLSIGAATLLVLLESPVSVTSLIVGMPTFLMSFLVTTIIIWGCAGPLVMLGAVGYLAVLVSRERPVSVLHLAYVGESCACFLALLAGSPAKTDVLWGDLLVVLAATALILNIEAWFNMTPSASKLFCLIALAVVVLYCGAIVALQMAVSV
jgi:hypothetical protein